MDDLGVRKCQYRRLKRCWLHPWVQKIPWNRKWQATPLFWPGKLHGQKPGEIQSMGSQRVENDWATKHARKFQLSQWVLSVYTTTSSNLVGMKLYFILILIQLIANEVDILSHMYWSRCFFFSEMHIYFFDILTLLFYFYFKVVIFSKILFYNL